MLTRIYCVRCKHSIHSLQCQQPTCSRTLPSFFLGGRVWLHVGYSVPCRCPGQVSATLGTNVRSTCLKHNNHCPLTKQFRQLSTEKTNDSHTNKKRSKRSCRQLKQFLFSTRETAQSSTTSKFALKRAQGNLSCIMAGPLLPENSGVLSLNFGWIILKTRKIYQCFNEDFAKKVRLVPLTGPITCYMSNLSHPCHVHSPHLKAI